jgi:hypothetical protein
VLTVVRRFILFTKTHWDEPPRLRHQFADLIAAAGHEVLFFEKPSSLGRVDPTMRSRRPRIVTTQHRELMHHKLRLTPALQRANARVTLASIRRRLREMPVRPDDVVVSFNYDYWFLRELFPKNHLMTVINDDFICVALFGYTKPLLWAMQRTCATSNRVLTVSVPLQKQLAPFTAPELFLPWADRPYQAPRAASQRDILLFWGFTNRRIHFPAVHALAETLQRDRPEVRIVFVGPIVQLREGVAEQVKLLTQRPNVEFRDSATLDSLALDRILAAYIPYRPFDLEIDAITLSNKALQLLARGLPLLISSLPALPNFIDAPFSIRVDDRDPGKQIDWLRANFDALQPAIREFVNANGADARARQLLRGLD